MLDFDAICGVPEHLAWELGSLGAARGELQLSRHRSRGSGRKALICVSAAASIQFHALDAFLVARVER